MVGRFVHDQNVRLPIINLPNSIRPFPHQKALSQAFDVVTAEQQTTENAAHRLLVIAFLLPLAHPFEHGQIIFELIFVVLSVVTNARIFQTILRCRCPVADRPPAFSAALIYRRRWYPVPPVFTHFQQQVEILNSGPLSNPLVETFHFQRVTGTVSYPVQNG